MVINFNFWDREIGEFIFFYLYLLEVINCKEFCRKCVFKKWGFKLLKNEERKDIGR